MKYCRTYHIIKSPGGTSDDKKLKSDSIFLNKEIIITSKLDGSNLCLSKNDVFARTHSGPPKHPSFDLAKSFHNQIKYSIPDNLFIYCEYLYAKHSIHYTKLPSYFTVFNILDIDRNIMLSWDDVEKICCDLNMITVPVLFKGHFKTEKSLYEEILKLVAQKEFNYDEREGVVIRIAKEFAVEDFAKNVGKWVRAAHVQTSEHWKDQEIIKNQLIS